MHSFTDAAGRAWTINLDFTAWSKVYAQLGIDLADISYGGEPDSLKQLQRPHFLGQVLWVLIEQQATDRKLSWDDVAASISGDVWQRAWRAIYDEMLFFCRPEQRTLLRALMDRAEAIAASPETEALIRKQLDEAFPLPGGSSISSPEVSASTPGPGASAGSASQPEAPGTSDGITPPKSTSHSETSTAATRPPLSPTTPGSIRSSRRDRRRKTSR